MPARAPDFERVARKLGFEKAARRAGMARWRHPDGRATTIPVHGDAEIGGWLFHQIIAQLGITEEDFQRLR